MCSSSRCVGRSALALVALAATVAGQIPLDLEAPRYGSPHEREFYFWIGEWKVNNRSLKKDGSYADSGEARARIRPILGGKAILEEWDGKSGTRTKTFGISIRVFDPSKQRWVISLNWPSAKNASFSRMEGTFRHGRGEFFPPNAFGAPPQQGGPRATRFTFSDGLQNTCRWDMANPVAGGAWRTSWIMEFSRTKSTADTIAAGEPIRRPPAKPVCTDPEARRFDALLGVWRGKGWRSDGESKREDVTATLRATSTNRGCATLCFLDVVAGGKTVQSFEAWAYEPGRKRWAGQAIDDEIPQLFFMTGNFQSASDGSFVRSNAAGRPLRNTRRVRYLTIAADTFRCTHEVSAKRGKNWRTVLSLEFKRGK